MSAGGTVTIGGSTVSGPPQRSAGTYFPALDGYRALAALSVVVFHSLAYTAPDRHWFSPYTRALGGAGVALFFVLSGFLLYRPFVLAYLGAGSAPRLRSFYTRRLFRIFPAYWVALAVLMAFGLAQMSTHDIGTVVTYASLTQNYRGQLWVLGGLFVAWTLCLELSFYLALPLVAWTIRTLGSRVQGIKGRVRFQVLALTALYLATIGYRVVNVMYLPSLAAQRAWLWGFFDYFTLGMLFATWSASFELGQRLPQILAMLARWPAVSLFFAAEFYFLEMRVGNPGLFEPVSNTQLILQQVMFGLAVAFLLLPGAFGPPLQGWWRRALASRPMTLLGLVSFGIYLWHPIWVLAIGRLISRNQYPNGFWTMILPVLVLTIACATLSYLIVEAPSIRLGRRVEQRLTGSGKPQDGQIVGLRDAPPVAASAPVASSAAASSASTAASHV
jgi:peptidoglycan/LPS O-acetylase OafA/YrhL